MWWEILPSAGILFVVAYTGPTLVELANKALFGTVRKRSWIPLKERTTGLHLLKP
jgi:hypothetical protein